MNLVTLHAYGKINLSLDVLGRRDDGYHEVRMLMQPVKLCDLVTVEKRKSGIELITDCGEIPSGRENLAYRAAEAMLHVFDINCGFSIKIQKKIPIAGGMAGGSADAAAVLSGINILCGLNRSKAQLAQIGAALGADVPFCLYERPMLAEGIGERLTEAPGLPPDYRIVLVNPGIGISTKEIYGEIDSLKDYGTIDHKKLIRFLTNRDLQGAARYMKNVMQDFSAAKCPAIVTIIETLNEMGAVHAMMSGSGDTCFGIFKRDSVPKDFARKFPGYFCELTEPVSEC